MEGSTYALDAICVFDESATRILSASELTLKFAPSSLDRTRSVLLLGPGSSSILAHDIVEIARYDDRVASNSGSSTNLMAGFNSNQGSSAGTTGATNGGFAGVGGGHSSHSNSATSSVSSSSSNVRLHQALVATDARARISMNYGVEFFDMTIGRYTPNPAPEVLLSMNIKVGANRMRITHPGSGAYLEFCIWAYTVKSKLVIVDVDGTITKSSVRGYVHTVFMHSYSYTHEGVAEFLRALVYEYGLNIVYLTSRPVFHLHETKQLLFSMWNKPVSASVIPSRRSAEPGDSNRASLAANSRKRMFINTVGGPIFANPESLAKAAYRELISQDTISFKSQVLMSILDVFSAAFAKAALTSPTANILPPLFMAFGNKDDDAIAYAHAGINPANIFVIDKSSKIRVWSTIFQIKALSKQQQILNGQYGQPSGLNSNPSSNPTTPNSSLRSIRNTSNDSTAGQSAASSSSRSVLSNRSVATAANAANSRSRSPAPASSLIVSNEEYDLNAPFSSYDDNDHLLIDLSNAAIHNANMRSLSSSAPPAARSRSGDGGFGVEGHGATNSSSKSTEQAIAALTAYTTRDINRSTSGSSVASVGVRTDRLAAADLDTVEVHHLGQGTIVAVDGVPREQQQLNPQAQADSNAATWQTSIRPAVVGRVIVSNSGSKETGGGRGTGSCRSIGTPCATTDNVPIDSPSRFLLRSDSSMRHKSPPAVLTRSSSIRRSSSSGSERESQPKPPALAIATVTGPSGSPPMQPHEPDVVQSILQQQQPLPPSLSQPLALQPISNASISSGKGASITPPLPPPPPAHKASPSPSPGIVVQRNLSGYHSNAFSVPAATSNMDTSTAKLASYSFNTYSDPNLLHYIESLVIVTEKE
jgi:hypothetical protein